MPVKYDVPVVNKRLLPTREEFVCPNGFPGTRYTFDSPQATGVIEVVVDNFGLFVYFPEYCREPAMLVDLHYRSEEYPGKLYPSGYYSAWLYNMGNPENYDARVLWHNGKMIVEGEL
jgi:hypothetical protein